LTHVQRMIRDLGRPEAYPHPAGDIVLHQTHISVVFLAGEFAYKLKKPVDFGFVDYSSLDARRGFCVSEVSLNRRLAPEVYLGVVPIVEAGGSLRVGAEGESGKVVEWAVKMRRLDDADTLLRRLERGRLDAGVLERLGALLARFHAKAARGGRIARFGAFEQIRQNALDNFEQTREHVGEVVPHDVHAHLEALTRSTLDEHKALIQSRADEGRPCDTHGDLRLEHIYVSGDGDITIVDCIEFNDAFRYADPIADIAFLVMDLLIRGYDREAERVLSSWFGDTGDEESRSLLPLYVSYRSAVRAKVHGFKALEAEVPESERESARRRAGMHWRFALTALAPPRERPRLVLVGGLPGTGKTTVARALKTDGWVDEVIRSDVVRKELAGLDPGASAASDYGSGIYGEAWTRRTYGECRKRAGRLLTGGSRVAVDASFRNDADRADFVALARELGVQPLFLECRLDPALASERIGGRRGDASDADAAVHQRMRQAWESASAPVARVRRVLESRGSPREVADRAAGIIAAALVVPGVEGEV